MLRTFMVAAVGIALLPSFVRAEGIEVGEVRWLDVRSRHPPALLR